MRTLNMTARYESDRRRVWAMSVRRSLTYAPWYVRLWHMPVARLLGIKRPRPWKRYGWPDV